MTMRAGDGRKKSRKLEQAQIASVECKTGMGALDVLFVAMRAGDGFRVARVFLFARGEGSLTDEAERGAGFAQGGIERDTFVEDEAVAFEMFAAAFLEIAQNAAIKLEHLREASLLQKRRRFLATNATGAKSHDWFVFEMTGQGLGRHREFAEVLEVERVGAAEGAEFYFVGVASVEKSDGSTFIEPFLQFSRRNFWSGTSAGVDSSNTEGDDLLFDLHQHSIERLMIALANFRGEVSETGNRSEVIEEPVGSVRLGRHDDVDSFQAEQDCAAHSCSDTHRAQRGLKCL
jgi:hypothetical protein